MAKAKSKKYLVAIVGRPNVGKSTLFNRLVGERKAILAEEPGTTRDVLFGTVEWHGYHFTVADTAGFEFDNDTKLATDVLAQTKLAIADADLILFTVNAKEGLNPDDLAAADMIRKYNKPVILLINKTDTKGSVLNVPDFYQFGFKDVFEIAAISGKGVGDMLDSITANLKKIAPTPPKLDEEPGIKIAILGRPNVGKSTLFNKLLGKERSVVSDVAGTTRDAINARIGYQGTMLEFIDTAGLRRRGKVEVGIEKFSSLRMLRSAAESDICLLLMEANEGIIAQDLHILQMVLENYRSVILVVNKWDAIEKTQSITSDYEKYIASKYKFAKWIPTIFISALSGQRVERLKDLVLETWAKANTELPAKELHNLINATVIKLAPKSTGKPTIIHKARQIDVNPITIELVVSRPEALHFTYLRYLENTIREHWNLMGAPIKFVVTEKPRG